MVCPWQRAAAKPPAAPFPPVQPRRREGGLVPSRTPKPPLMPPQVEDATEEEQNESSPPRGAAQVGPPPRCQSRDRATPGQQHWPAKTDQVQQPAHDALRKSTRWRPPQKQSMWRPLPVQPSRRRWWPLGGPTAGRLARRLPTVAYPGMRHRRGAVWGRVSLAAEKELPNSQGRNLKSPHMCHHPLRWPPAPAAHDPTWAGAGVRPWGGKLSRALAAVLHVDGGG